MTKGEKLFQKYKNCPAEYLDRKGTVIGHNDDYLIMSVPEFTGWGITSVKNCYFYNDNPQEGYYLYIGEDSVIKENEKSL